ncbi:histone deacetylase HDT2-like [Hordeum vulgare subsp. vulgare]|uniref:Histone deacetylase HD2 isoform 1 n=1 Tax=Hordeum vulgare TaxID=4513 RepID=C1IC97_HORVU|nr:histone deacetylase HDT2-like [Hordeum vulgare subsp. vulgare]ACD50315.1 histone deacetylase HD2 isoform 1 [Hordeum vulgare]
MEFWGLEVKPNQSIKVSPEDDHFLHLSQAALGEVKKDDKTTLFVRVDGGQKLAIGTLSMDKFPQIQFDLVFEKEFELSHNSKTTSVFFSGYNVFQPAQGDEMDFDSEDESESEDEQEPIIPPVAKENGKPEAKEQKKQVLIDTGSSKSKAAAKDIGKSKKDDDSDDDGSDDDDSEDDSADGALIPMGDDSDDSEEGDEDSDSDEDSSDEEEEETPKKQETGKKRAAGSDIKTPVADKKAKIATPSGQKTGDKKGAVHVATPHPAKKVGKTPATSDKSPKSGGSVACKSCTKTFNSEVALASHAKAKHAAK